MAKYPQIDDCSGIWTLEEVNDAVAKGLWRNHGSRAICGGGQISPGNSDIIEYHIIASTGDFADFGNLTDERTLLGSCGSHTRGVFAGGKVPGDTNIIDYITMSSTGDAADFGDLVGARREVGGVSNSTRGIFAGGNPGSNVIEYVTIASTGNTTDFGNLTSARSQASDAPCGSPTRALFAGGYPSSDIIDYVEIATTGNAVDFADLKAAEAFLSGTSSSIRAIWAGGQTPMNNDIQYLTIACLLYTSPSPRD